MSFKVDVDEADVAVLNQNLARSKELFTSISTSLTKIASKSTNASNNIKPILKDVNKLYESKRQVENGLRLLSEVNETAALIHKHEDVLNNPIESIGLRRFIDTLGKSRALLATVRSKYKQFTGISINFETLIDKSEIKLQTYFSGLTHQPAAKIMENSMKTDDIAMVFRYFSKDSGHISKIYARSRSMLLVDKMKPLQQAVFTVSERNIPYERGTNGINRFNNELIKSIKQEIELLETLKVPPAEFANPLCERVIVDLYTHDIIGYFNKFFSTSTAIVTHDILMLEVTENLIHFHQFLENFGLKNKEFTNSVNLYVTKNSVIFKEYFKLIEAKFSAVPNLNDTNIPQITVDLISRIRKASEFSKALLRLIEGYNLGDWLSIKPPVKFVTVYTSVVPNNTNDTSPQFLLSSFFSDILDSIMINIEIGLKSNTETNIRKSTQGFYLIKNLVMIETIINRSSTLYEKLGSLGMERLNKLKNRFLKIFLDDWNYASYIIIRDMTSIATNNAHSGGVSSGSTGGGSGQHLSSKEKEQVKELFKTFNESFEEAIGNYERYNITDTNLRTFLGNEVKKLIINAYFKLYDKYGNSDFTKNRQKYVKYDKQSFEKLLNDKL